MPKSVKPVVWNVFVHGRSVGAIKASPTREFAVEEVVWLKNKKFVVSTVLADERKLDGTFVEA